MLKFVVFVVISSIQNAICLFSGWRAKAKKKKKKNLVLQSLDQLLLIQAHVSLRRKRKLKTKK